MRRINALGFVAGSLAVAALGAAMWTSAGRVPEANSAGAEIMQILRDEHALVADYVKMDTEAKRLANATADQEAATLRLAAIERSRLRLAQAHAEAEPKIQAAPEAKPERQQAVARASARGAPLAVAATAPVGQPLPPVQTANATIAALAPAEGPVRSRLRQLVSDVQRLPEWVISAADWVTEAVPRLPRLPGHEFSAEL